MRQDFVSRALSACFAFSEGGSVEQLMVDLGLPPDTPPVILIDAFKSADYTTYPELSSIEVLLRESLLWPYVLRASDPISELRDLALLVESASSRRVVAFLRHRAARPT